MTPQVAEAEAAQAAAPAPRKVKPPRDCGCGCGGQTKGGEFVIGHDSKLKSRLINEAVAGGPKGQAAEKVLADRKWTKFLDQKREATARKEQKRANVAAAKAASGKGAE